MKIAVLGAGAFGTSLAQSLAADTREVTLWGRASPHFADLQTTRVSRHFPEVQLAPSLTISESFPDQSHDLFLLAIPMQQLRGLLDAHPQLAEKPLIACCKGIELATGLGPVAVIQDVLPSATAALLTGPSFAKDIANGLPTALTLACTDKEAGAEIQSALMARNLRIYRTRDVTGAAFGGALKNVIAIACGAASGAGLGESARAALMTRGFAEMTRIAVAQGAQAETLTGLSGFGDLALTCNSTLSRNYQLGLALGQGVEFDPNITVEGAATARATQALAQTLSIDMPITNVVVGLLDQKLNLREAVTALLSRPAKEE